MMETSQRLVVLFKGRDAADKIVGPAAEVVEFGKRPGHFGAAAPDLNDGAGPRSGIDR
jgi:hypothetical protein